MPTTYSEFPEKTLVQKRDSKYDRFKLYKCPVAWGIVWL